MMSSAWQTKEVMDVFERMAPLREKVCRADQTIADIVKGPDMRVLVAKIFTIIIGNGHALLEGVPGTAKTLLCQAIAGVYSGYFRKYQLTVDTMPVDLKGYEDIHITDIVDPETDKRTRDVVRTLIWGILSPKINLFLADEINRALAKVIGAILEVMQEKEITIAGHKLTMPEVFTVLGTMNPVELGQATSELPDAAKDRFWAKFIVPHPDSPTVYEILEDAALGRRKDKLDLPEIMHTEDILEMRALMLEFNQKAVPPPSLQYSGALGYVYAMDDWFKQAPFTEKYRGVIHSVPYHQSVRQSALSPRALEQLLSAARFAAFLFPTDKYLCFPLVEHVQWLYHDCFCHRFRFTPSHSTPEAQIIATDKILDDCLKDLCAGSRGAGGGPKVQLGNKFWEPKEAEWKLTV